MKTNCDVLLIGFDYICLRLAKDLEYYFDSFQFLDYSAIHNYASLYSSNPKVVLLYEFGVGSGISPDALDFPGKSEVPIVYVSSNVDFDFLGKLVQEINIRTILSGSSSDDLVRECHKIITSERWRQGAENFLKKVSNDVR